MITLKNNGYPIAKGSLSITEFKEFYPEVKKWFERFHKNEVIETKPKERIDKNNCVIEIGGFIFVFDEIEES